MMLRELCHPHVLLSCIFVYPLLNFLPTNAYCYGIILLLGFSFLIFWGLKDLQHSEKAAVNWCYSHKTELKFHHLTEIGLFSSFMTIWLENCITSK